MEQLLKDQLAHLDLTGKVVKIETFAYCGGGFGDVWRGQSGGTEVAIKIPKVYERNDNRPLEVVANVSISESIILYDMSLVTMSITGSLQRDTYLVTTSS